MPWSGVTGAIARCKSRSIACVHKSRFVLAWRWICGVKPKPKAVNKPSHHSIRPELDKPGVFTTVSLILADQAEKAIRQVQESVLELLAQHYPAEQAAHLARVLSEGTWTHDYPISVTKAQELGLPVSDKMPPAVLQLMQLFPQPAQHRVPSVEYLPGPRHAPETPGSRRR